MFSGEVKTLHFCMLFIRINFRGIPQELLTTGCGDLLQESRKTEGIQWIGELVEQVRNTCIHRDMRHLLYSGIHWPAGRLIFVSC
jgi:hypothetical protein